MVWVLSGDAPVADVNEYAVLGAMADMASPDGCGCWLSKETLAARTHVSEETVKRCWRNMLRRGLIGKGDQSLVRHYRADRRPVVYDLLIPYGWFSNVDRVNAERARRGLPALTPADRPDVAPAPEKKTRVDKGKPRPKKTVESRGNSETPREEVAGGTAEEPDGGTTSRPRGNYESSTGELVVPQSRGVTQSVTREDPPVRPSVSVGSGVRASETDGWTDGGGGVIEEEPVRPRAVDAEPAAADASPDNGAAAAEAVTGRGPAAECPPVADTPGVQVLREVAAGDDDYLVTGQTLADQGQVITGMLAAGWKVSHVKKVITARPLPDRMTHGVGAVIAGRLRKAAAGPPPSPTATWGPVPAQPRSGEYNPVDHSSTGVADRTVEEAKSHRVHYECAVCSREPVPGFDLCEDCAELPSCATGCGRRAPDEGEVCDACAETWAAAGVTALPAEDGKCPGRNGQTCDGRAQRGTVLGLCGRCRMQAERERRTALAADQLTHQAPASTSTRTGHQPYRQPAPVVDLGFF